MVERLTGVPGVEVLNEAYFNEVTLLLPVNAREVFQKLADRGVLGGVSLGRLYASAPDLERGLLVTATETTSEEDIETFARELAEVVA